MQLKLSLLLPFLFPFFNTVYTQKTPKSETTNTQLSQHFFDRTEFKVGYTGTIFWANGLNFGAEYLLKETLKTKNRKRGNRTNTHQFLLNGNLAFTTNFATKTDTGLLTNVGLIWRRTNKKGKQFSIGVNPLGYYRSFLPKTYEVNGDSVDEVFLPGRGYYAPSLSVGIGKQRKGKKLTGRYLNINFMLRTPYNAGALPSFSVQYGFRFHLKKKN